MAKRTNAKLIGGFVTGAIGLVIVAALVFGGSQFLSTKDKAVLFFQGSLSGLDAGSPVTFRGVKIGTVTSVGILYDVPKAELEIPVHIEIEPEQVQIVNGARGIKNIKTLVARGLKAQLQSVSLVTGQTAVDFDFHPEVPIRLMGLERGMLELPTVPSTIDILKANVSALLAKINKLPLDQLGTQMLDMTRTGNDTLKSLQAVVNDTGARLDALSDSLLKVLDQANLTLTEARSRLQLRPGEPMQKLNDTLDSTKRLVDNADRNLPQLLAAAHQVLKAATSALNQADSMLSAAQRSISPSSPLYFELNGTLRELRSAATAIRVFAEYIQRNPSAFVTGKQ
jgi:paraquat-inducible protein B